MSTKIDKKAVLKAVRTLQNQLSEIINERDARSIQIREQYADEEHLREWHECRGHSAALSLALRKVNELFEQLEEL